MNELEKYRQDLEQLKQAMEAKYDSTVLALSSGGIGVSVLALQALQINLDCQNRYLVGIGWISWGLSCVCVMVSFLSSKIALSKVITDIDEGKEISGKCGGLYDRLTTLLNLLSGLFFLLGLASVSLVLFSNL